MNILRRSRKRVNKISFKKYLILVFLFIMTAFAWITYSRILNPNMKLHINSWNIETYVDTNKNFVADAGEIDADGTVNVSVVNLYPGMDEDITDVIIKNNGEVATSITYNVNNIWILGNSHTFTTDPSATGNYILENSSTENDGIKTYEFIKQDTKYPFQIKLESSTQIKGGAEGYIKIRIVWPLEDDADSNTLDSKWGYDIAKYTGAANRLFSFNLQVEAIGTDESSRDLFVSKVNPENYGDPVKYGVDLNDNGNLTDDWLIFCEHRNNIYLIAKDYVKSSLVENSEMTPVSGSNYRINWNSLAKLGTSSITSQMKHRYMLTQASISGDANWKATASLLTPTYWDGHLKDTNGYADTIIGGPTIEMFIKSWNQKFINSASYPQLRCVWNEDKKGYEIGLLTGELGNVLNLTKDTNTALYFANTIAADSSCNCYWIASPSSGGEYSIIRASNGGEIKFNGYSNDLLGVRPVVCLKDTVVATQNASGVWILGEEEYTNTVYDKDGNVIPEEVIE